MIKKTIVLTLIISILTLLSACASDQAVFENGTELEKTSTPDTSALLDEIIKTDEITKEEFLRYPGADKILDKISKEYGKEGVSLSYGFLKRCNGLLHINIDSETKDDSTHFYITYKIAENGTPVEVESGEGYYVPAVNKDIAIYK